MTTLDLAIQIQSLRTQLEVLAARLRSTPSMPNHTLGDLHGMLSHQSQSSAEEIDQVLFHGPAVCTPLE